MGNARHIKGSHIMSAPLSHTKLDAYAVDALIQRERAARDAQRWDEMAVCYHPDSHVEVSWFQGSGADFVVGSRKLAAMTFTLHQMSPAVVSIEGDRAIADTGCIIHAFTMLEGVEVTIASHGRLLWRALRSGDDWLIAGMRAYYIRDTISPTRPGVVPVIDEELYQSFRRPFRSIAYSAARAGRPVRELPGTDRPEEIATMVQAERLWLAGD